MAGLTAEEKARRKAERQRRIEEQERQMKEVMEQSRSALEIMNELNADGGASVSSLGSGRTHSTGVPAVLEVLDEEAPGPLPTTSTSGKGGSHPPPGHDKFMESRTWGMDSATVERTAPRLSKTESARKFLWDEDDDGAGGAVGGGAGGKTTPGGGGLFSPSSRRQSRESDTEEIERAIDKTIDNVVGSGGDLSGAATSTVSGDERRGSAISKLTSTLRGLAWGMGDGADNNDSMTSINLAPRGEPAPAAPATSTPNRRTAGARMLTNAISHSLRNIQAADSDYDNEKSHGRRILTSVTMSGAATKEWCFNHRRLAVLVAGAAVVIGSVLLIGQNSGVMSPSTESGRGGIGLRPSMPTFHFNSGSKSKKSDRYKAIKASIIRARVSDESDFKDQHTAQSRALDWISNEDEGKLETTDPFILQRYSLAVLWFNTAYSEAEMKRSPYPEKGEEDEEDPTILMETWDDTDYWLTKAGICMFYGVTCHHRPGTPLTEVTYNDNNGVTSLRLMKNNLQGSLPKEIFTGLPDLRVLELQGNDLVGTLPIEIGNLRKIEYLKLENNSLSSTIPTEICLLDRLEHLEIGNNDWTGILPEELGELQQLSALGVFNSQLTGTLPSSLGKLVNMRQLYLDFNQLTGTFPATLAALTNLIDLRLRRNALSGSIPSEIGNLKSLNVLYLDGNELSGTSEWLAWTNANSISCHCYISHRLTVLCVYNSCCNVCIHIFCLSYNSTIDSQQT